MNSANLYINSILSHGAIPLLLSQQEYLIIDQP